MIRKGLISERENIEISSTSAVLGFMFIEMVLIGSPSVLSTWITVNYLTILGITFLGIILGSLYIFKSPSNSKALDFGAIGIYFIALSVVLWVKNPVVFIIAVLIVQASALIILEMGIRPGSTKSIKILGARMGGIQFLIIILIFMLVAVPFWTAMPPALHGILRDNGNVFIYLVGSILPISTLMSVYIWRD